MLTQAQQKKSVQFQGTLQVALSGILYGFLGYFGTKVLQTNMAVATMLFWRFFIAGVWMLVYYHVWTEKQTFQLPPWRNLASLFILGGVCYGSGSGFYFLASQSIGTGLAMVIFFSYPLFVALYTVMENKSAFNFFTILSLFSIVLGLVLLKGNAHHAVSMAGIVLAVISAIGYAIYIIKSKYILQNMVSIHATIMVCFSGAITFYVIAHSLHQFSVPTSFQAWVYLLAVGIAATAVPIQLMLNGLKTVHPLKASLISVLEPAVTVLVGIILLKENISFQQTMGMVILLVGSVLAQL